MVGKQAWQPNTCIEAVISHRCDSALDRSQSGAQHAKEVTGHQSAAHHRRPERSLCIHDSYS